MKRSHFSLLAVCVICAMLALCGCESLGKKFIRKKPKAEGPVAGMVARPEEYAGQESREDRYAKSFLYWKSWYSEFVDALREPSHKRQFETLDESLKYLAEIRDLVDAKRAQKIDGRIKQLGEFRARVAQDVYFTRAADLQLEADRIGRQIMDDLKGAR